MDSMSVQSRAALLVDMDTDLVMYEQNAHTKSYPASITKVMTALLVLEAVEDGQLALDQMITAGESAWQGLTEAEVGQKIQIGEEMSLEDLLNCMMVASANEAANILAATVSGSIEAFVDRMNERATELGCEGTHFANPSGMPDDNHYSTAYDLYLIAKEAMTHDRFRTIVSTIEYYVEPTNMTERQRHFFNTNGLLSNKKYAGYYYENCIGIKTGSTTAAGYCLLSAAEKEGQTLICVLLGCENPKDENGEPQRLQFSESTRLLEWGFKNFSVHTILDATDPVAEIPVTLSSECDYVSVIVDGTLEAQLPKDITGNDFDWTTELPDSVEAPISAGQKLGTLTLTLDGEDYGTVDLVAVNDVTRSDLLALREDVLRIIQSWQFRIAVIAVVVVALAVVLRIIYVRHMRRLYGDRRKRDYRGKRDQS
ncbi:MAG: D-alanyl-D-alanine carboxypeptidase [Oscillospiraceae bacterium]|nr:D-alanyl-D-alanine carboxypeptidase [Oscillospiraceae bacterium]